MVGEGRRGGGSGLLRLGLLVFVLRGFVGYTWLKTYFVYLATGGTVALRLMNSFGQEQN